MAYKNTYNPCDDCPYSFSKNNQESSMCKVCEFKQLLNKPTVDVVKVKHGEWKRTDADGTWECSLCGGEIVADAYGDVHPLDDCGMIGCPYCLAKMDGGDKR